MSFTKISIGKYPSEYLTDAHRNCVGERFANHYNINNLVCVVKAYTTLGVAIGVVFFGVVRGWFFGLSNNMAYMYTHSSTS